MREYDIREFTGVEFDEYGNPTYGSLCFLESFVVYPCMFLGRLSKKIENGKLTSQEIIQLIEFINLDTYCLRRAVESGVHPLTGCIWSGYRNGKDEADKLITRNNRLIEVLKGIIRADNLKNK